MNKIISCIVFFLCSFSVVASDVTQLNNLTKNPTELTGHFSQSKYFQQLDTSIQSTGTFHYQKEKQVISWHTLSPIENVLELTPNSIISSQGDNQTAQLGSDSNPAVSAFSNIFFGVMSAQWDILEQYFIVTAVISGDSWEATLIPNDPIVNNFLSKATLSGHHYLQNLTLFEENGNLTEIQFDRFQ